MTGSVIGLVLAGLSVLLLAYKVIDLIRSPHRPALWALWGGIAAFLLGFCTTLVNSLAGSPWNPNVVWLVQHLLLAATAVLILLFFHLSVGEAAGDLRHRRIVMRIQYASLGLCNAVMLACWAISVVTTNHPDFINLNLAHHPWMLATVLAYLAGESLAFWLTGRMAWRWSRLSDRPWIRRSLGTVTIGFGSGGLYATHKLVYSLTAASGHPLPWPETVETVPIAIAVVTIVGGLTMPAWGPVAWHVLRYPRLRRAYRELRPVWSAVISAFPDIELTLYDHAPPTHPRRPGALRRAWNRVRHLDTIIYRMVIEIWDGRAALDHWLNPELTRRAESRSDQLGLGGPERNAAIEATLYRHGIAAHIAGAHATGTEHRYPRDVGNDLARHVEFLRHVARWFATPLIPTTEPGPTPTAAR